MGIRWVQARAGADLPAAGRAQMSIHKTQSVCYTLCHLIGSSLRRPPWFRLDLAAALDRDLTQAETESWLCAGPLWAALTSLSHRASSVRAEG